MAARQQIDKEQLIDLVHERPAIWDKNLPEYKIKSARTQAWREICSILDDNYAKKFSHSKKVEYHMAVVKAWTNIRDGWVRSIKKRGQNAHRYYYHNKLLFLTDVINPQYNNQDTEYQNVEYLYPESDKSEEDTDKSDELEETEIKQEFDEISDNKSLKSKRNRISKDVQSDDYEGEIKELTPKRFRVLQDELKANRSEEVLIPFPNFEDRHLCFFKGIQPSLATLDEREVLEFQSGVIRLLQSIRNRHE